LECGHGQEQNGSGFFKDNILVINYLVDDLIFKGVAIIVALLKMF
jgi:hypothetical protein